FFFSSRRRHTRFSRDWSSDVCSSDLVPVDNRHQLDTGQLVPVVNRDGEQQFVVMVLAKPKPGEDGRKRKGEEISVNLPHDPGDEIGRASSRERGVSRGGRSAVGEASH